MTWIEELDAMVLASIDRTISEAISIVLDPRFPAPHSGGIVDFATIPPGTWISRDPHLMIRPSHDPIDPAPRTLSATIRAVFDAPILLATPPPPLDRKNAPALPTPHARSRVFSPAHSLAAMSGCTQVRGTGPTPPITVHPTTVKVSIPKS